MPESVDVLDDLIEDYIRRECGYFRHFMDIGAGTGKYGKLVKWIFEPVSVVVDAVEIDSTYVSNYKLRDIYDHIYTMDVEDFIGRYVDYTCDVCIIGDCIEHLRKSVGMDVLHFFVYRAKKVIVAYPDRMPQGSWAGHKQEAHISVWDERDFSLFEYTHVAKSFMRLVVVEGYLR